MSEADNLPTSGETKLVHKDGEEGAILIDALTGHVITGQQDKPEWADGLMLAVLLERKDWYTTALGPELAQPFLEPEAYNYADLWWTAGTNEFETVEIEPDAEFRSKVIHAIAQREGVFDKGGNYLGNATNVVSLGLDRQRTVEEISALQHETEAFKDRKTGTEG